LHRSAHPLLRVWLLALCGAFFVLLWQFATVRANYGGNWTALFTTGALEKQPPVNAQEHVYLFAKSHGYDGQFYRYIAHDPFLRTDLKKYVDDPRLRYRRILVPLLAYLLAAGRQDWIDPAYELVCLASIALGVYWSCRIAQTSGIAAAWGLIFLALPAIAITADRLVVDGALAALTAAFVYYSASPSWKLFVVLALAALTRETGLLLVLAYCAYLAWRREIRWAGIFVLSILPAAAWNAYLAVKTPSAAYPFSLIPLSAILHVLGHPWHYPPGTPFAGIVVAADYLALAGVLLAFGLALAVFVRSPADPVHIAAAFFAVMGLTFQRIDHWQNVYDFGRVYTPALACLAAVAARGRNPWLLLPMAMMLPRIAIQLAPQALGVIHWIIG